MTHILDAVKDMIKKEYGATPTSPGADTPMSASIQEQIRELEDQAAECLARAAYLRQSAGLVSESSAAVPKTQGAMPPKAWPEGPAQGHDPDATDGWERVLMH
jgi:hypothetical protein